MKGLIPFGGLVITSGSPTLALTTTPTLFNIWQALAPDSTLGDASVRPDLANNRIMAGIPGTYKFNYSISGQTGTAGIMTFQLRKNAATLIPGTACSQSWAGSSADNVISFSGLFVIAPGDYSATQSQPNFPDPVQGAQAFYPSFAGAGGAPHSQCPIDMVVSVGTSTATLTIVTGNWTIEREG
jgi:hypothetical protein